MNGSIDATSGGQPGGSGGAAKLPWITPRMQVHKVSEITKFDTVTYPNDSPHNISPS